MGACAIENTGGAHERSDAVVGTAGRHAGHDVCQRQKARPFQPPVRPARSTQRNMHPPPPLKISELKILKLKIVELKILTLKITDTEGTGAQLSTRASEWETQASSG